jgi:uncharacterized membrane protein YccC
MTAAQLAWAFRTVMIVAAAVDTYLLTQTDIALSPEWKVILGAMVVALAALNPQTVANKLSGSA